MYNNYEEKSKQFEISFCVFYEKISRERGMLLLFMADGNQKRQQGQHRAYACYSYPAPGLPATAGEEGPQ